MELEQDRIAPGRSSIPRPGQVIEWFKAPVLQGNANYAISIAAGRPLLFLFFGSASDPRVQAALDLVLAQSDLFDDVRSCFFGVTIDPDDEGARRIAPRIPGIRYFIDYSRELSMMFGAIDRSDPSHYIPHWLVVDRQLRLVGRYRLDEYQRAMAVLQKHIARGQEDSWAPVLEVPDVLEPGLCDHLVNLYREQGGVESGFMRDVNGKTVHVIDHGHKQRSDLMLNDPELRRRLLARIHDRVLPMISRAFQFEVTRMERYIVACYDAESGGHFRPHRDNTTKGTAHRRFAVTINLNTGEYDGGQLMFPEYGQRSYLAPKGGAIVFSCSLLHQALPVTRGQRFAFLPFLYDEAAAQIRLANNDFLGEGVGQYRVGAQSS
ncbi:MAG: 2OG-Fe(II) oxygenase [Sphingomonadales bacterium]|jgi:predicted 2-oxoglutarate/Fe(II)-dependent dioxygenase YbiX|nr:2OG-Fe(II) oxygenase [Sphingomonadales bacterium]MBK9003178.1 2OG-Fe(II) oxygenase [Sphingomonadales bacterium]MBK9268426.1 2OG-Fe(II) oxygenase [Sphingomonadales bacterium]